MKTFWNSEYRKEKNFARGYEVALPLDYLQRKEK